MDKNKPTPQILTDRIKIGQLYITEDNDPDHESDTGLHVYINKETGDTDYPFSGVVFNDPGRGDAEMRYTAFGQIQDTENLRRYALKEKSVYSI